MQKPRHPDFAEICKVDAAPMAAIFYPLLTLLASRTRQELAQQVAYLKAGKLILRSCKVTQADRAEHSGAPPTGAISIVSYSAFRKWVRSVEGAIDKRPKPKNAKPGRPPLPPPVEESISEAIIRIRRETGLGYTQIGQAMRRLGHKVSRQTIENVLAQAGLGPEPQDHPDTWSGFLKRHADTMRQCNECLQSEMGDSRHGRFIFPGLHPHRLTADLGFSLHRQPRGRVDHAAGPRLRHVPAR